jgi:hypothetical protein
MIVVGSLVRAFAGLRVAGLALARVAPLIGSAFHLMLGPLGLVTAAVSALALGFATDFLGMRTFIEEQARQIGGVFDNFAMDLGDMGTTIHALADETGVSFEDMKATITREMEQSGDTLEEVVRRMRGVLRDDLSPALLKSGADWESYQNQITVQTQSATATVIAGVDTMADETGELPGEMADALLANQFELDDAITQMVNFMEQALSPAEERFNARAFLSSQAYKDGLNSGIPSVVLKAQELAAEAQAVLDNTDFFGAGQGAGYSFGAGLVDPAVIRFVSSSAYRLAQAARGVFPSSEPKDPNSPLRGITKGFGFGEVLAKGILTGASTLQGAFRSLVGGGLTMPALAGAGAGARGGATVVNNFYLQWSGEPPKGRSEDEIIATLQRLSPLIGGKLAPGY